MDNYLYTEEVLKRLPLPLALCDDGSPLYAEETFMYFLEMRKVPYTLEANLYDRDDHNLAQYKTIAFNTQDSGQYLNPRAENLFSFEKDNLKMIIVLSSNAFKKVEILSKELNIECVGFLPGNILFTDPFEIPSGRFW